MKPFKSLKLGSGLQLAFFDRSIRYFGDYYRILVDVQVAFDLPEGAMKEIFWQKAKTVFGERFSFTRTLERMAVPTAEAEQVRDRLVDDFLNNTGAYLQRPEYLQSLVAAALKKRCHGRGYGI